MTSTSLIIADAFHRVGLIEERGRGNNRVIEMCRTAMKKALKPLVRPVSR